MPESALLAGAGAARPPALLGVSLKLYLDIARTRAWARDVAALSRASEAVREGRVRLFALPSLPAMTAVQQELAGTPVSWGAQDLHWEDRGAFTGAVSGSDLADLGCRYVEVGHAERKRIFGEDTETIGRKLDAAFRNGLIPVMCVGEPESTSPDEAAEVCIVQLSDALAHVTSIDERSEIVVAYEPEWAIGQAEPASAEYVRSVGTRLRAWLDTDLAHVPASVIYGGSAQRGTIGALAGDVDGLFLGRFAHDAAALADIVDEIAGSQN